MTLNTIFKFVALMMLANNSSAQPTYERAGKYGGSGVDSGSEITTNVSGNIYIVGSFESTADFDAGAGTNLLTPIGAYDYFISHLDPSGNLV